MIISYRLNIEIIRYLKNNRSFNHVDILWFFVQVNFNPDFMSFLEWNRELGTVMSNLEVLQLCESHGFRNNSISSQFQEQLQQVFHS